MGLNIALDYCPQFIFEALLCMIHAALLAFETIEKCSLFCWRWYVSIDGLENWNSRFMPSLGSLREDSNELNKLPRHLAIVLAEEADFSMNDLSNVIAWAVCFGVPYISLYNNEDELLSCQDSMQKKIVINLKQLLGENYTSYSLIVKDSSKSYDNGYVHTRGVCVQIISNKDGRGDIVNTAKKIVSSISDRDHGIKDLNSFLINGNLKATRGLPDPDLVLQFGNTISLNGFLPWQTRLTEIISFSCIKNIRYPEFFKALKRYGKSKQRFGK